MKNVFIGFLLFSSLNYSLFANQKIIELPESIESVLEVEDDEQLEFEELLEREEVLLNLYSQSIRGRLGLNHFYQVLIQWGAPQGFIKEIDQVYNKLESGEISKEEALVFLNDVVKKLNKAQKDSQVYSDALDRVTFFLAVLPVYYLIIE